MANRKIAAIGYCMGGEIVLEMARSGEDIAGVQFSWPSCDTDARKTGPDQSAPCWFAMAEQIQWSRPNRCALSWRKWIVLGVDCHFHNYTGVVHGFTDPESDRKPLDAVSL